jgi:hypothetical protein
MQKIHAKAFQKTFNLRHIIYQSYRFNIKFTFQSKLASSFIFIVTLAVIEKTPLRNVETKNIEAQKLDNMMNDLCKSYDKENQRSSDKIRLLNTIACHFTNKELKKAFPCSDH